MPDRWRTAGIVSAAVAFVALILVLGWAYPPRTSVVSTDRLGPDAGERVADYLTRARDSLGGTDTDEHWALVSLAVGVAPDRIPEHVAGLRISQVLYHVPIDRVYTPPMTVPVPAGDAVAVASAQAAAGALDNSRPSDDRARRITAVMASRLHAGCTCAVDLVIRGRLGQLRDLSSRTDIRAVQALPADASAGAFAVLPLLPEQVDTVVPGPDDGQVPDN